MWPRVALLIVFLLASGSMDFLWRREIKLSSTPTSGLLQKHSKAIQLAASLKNFYQPHINQMVLIMTLSISKSQINISTFFWGGGAEIQQTNKHLTAICLLDLFQQLKLKFIAPFSSYSIIKEMLIRVRRLDLRTWKRNPSTASLQEKLLKDRECVPQRRTRSVALLL